MSCGSVNPAGVGADDTDSPRPSPPHRSRTPPCMMLQIGILFALLCAVGSNVAFFLKHRGACSAPAVDIRHPLHTAAELWSSKWFAIGMGVGGLAWLLHVAALSLAPMSIVQAVARRRRRADRRDGGPDLRLQRRPPSVVGPRPDRPSVSSCWSSRCPRAPGRHASYSLAPMIAFEAALLGIGALLIVGPHAAGARAEHHGVALAIAAGVLFGVCNVAVKALSGLVGHARGARARSAPGLIVAICASIAAFYASARSLQDGEAVTVIAAHRHRRERLLHRRRHRRLRRPAAGRHARHRPAGHRLPARDRRLGADAGAARRAARPPPVRRPPPERRAYAARTTAPRCCCSASLRRGYAPL